MKTQAELAAMKVATNARKERVLTTIKVSDVVGRAVSLVRAGSEFTGLCPFHNDTNVGSFMVNDAKGIFKCFACGETGSALDFLIKHRGMPFLDALAALESDAGLSSIDFNDPAKVRELEAARAAREAAAAKDAEGRRTHAESLWLGAEPIGRNGVATPALAYLKGRGIDLAEMGKVPGALRWRPDIGHPDFKGRRDNRHAAMIAGIFALSGQVVGCHRTYLDISGWEHATRSGRVTKLGGVSDAKLTLGPSLGGHIPLWKGEHRHPLKDIPPGTDVYMSEGIEDGLSVAYASPSRRVIAGVSGSKLGSVDLPEQMGRLILIGQRHKYTGEPDDGFEAAIAKQQARGHKVSMMWPPEAPPSHFFKDFNDQLNGIESAYRRGNACGPTEQ